MPYRNTSDPQPWDMNQLAEVIARPIMPGNLKLNVEHENITDGCLVLETDVHIQLP